LSDWPRTGQIRIAALKLQIYIVLSLLSSPFVFITRSKWYKFTTKALEAIPGAFDYAIPSSPFVFITRSKWYTFATKALEAIPGAFDYGIPIRPMHELEGIKGEGGRNIGNNSVLTHFKGQNSFKWLFDPF
jgi:hypothetical protein